MNLRIASLVLATAVAGAAQEAPVVREGPYWVGNVGDSFAIAAQSRLQINTRGNVVVRSGAGDQVAYRVRQRVMTVNEDRARILLGGGGARVSSVRNQRSRFRWRGAVADQRRRDPARQDWRIRAVFLGRRPGGD
jgi:hypothetical protein